MTSISAVPGLAAARATIEQVQEAGAALGHAVAQEAELQRNRPLEKAAAIRRLMDDPEGNPLTGKAHSASSAEAVVERDPAYAALCRQCAEATVQVILARAELDATRLLARLCLLAFGLDADAGEGEDR
jgi:hypothetical protein